MKIAHHSSHHSSRISLHTSLRASSHTSSRASQHTFPHISLRTLSRASTVSHQRGASIVIALGIIAALSAFTIGIGSTMLIAIQNTSSSKKALQAEYMAQSGIESARYVLKDLGVAYGGVAKTGTICSKLVCASVMSGATTCSCDEAASNFNKTESIYSTYEISGKDASPNTKYADNTRSVPICGTGDAGENCSIGGSASASDLPCNWNKLYYGDSFEIPLYTADESGNITNFSILSISNLTLKVKTANRENAVTDPGQNPENPQGNMVVNWSINGTCPSLGGDDSCGITGIYKDTVSSVITENDLSDGSHSMDLLSLTATDINDSTITTVSAFLQTVDKPVLKVSSVREVKTVDNVLIPYLEYQLLYSGGSLAASYVVTVKGHAEDFDYKLNGVTGLGAGLFDFAVQQ